MPATDLVAWGLPRLGQLLPLDEESLTQIITYSASLPKDASAEHLKNLLGDSPAALEFIASFNSRRDTQQQPSTLSPARSGEPATDNNNSNTPSSRDRNGGRKNKKARAPLHSTGPPRRPENHGDVTGGYRKADREEDYMAATSSRERTKPDTTAKGLDTATSGLSADPAALQVPQVASPYASSAGSSRNQSPAPKPASSKPPPSASGPLISDFLPNVRSKAAKASSRSGGSGTSTPSSSKGGALTTTNIADLTAAIAALEVSTNPTLGKGTRKCNCYASIHPLFAPAPNCLNCGKIICSLEGLQPCSFCGTPLLSGEEVQSMIRELRAERGQEKMRAHNESVHHDGGPRLGSSSPSRLEAAKAHRDKLLAFQAQNAKRTRVVDEAADFETPNVASTLWMSPAQRALALKKQQRILREMEEKARPEWEKKQTVMSLDIKGGRVTKVYHSAGPAESSTPKEEEEADAEDDLTHTQGSTSRGREAFGNNPLLAAGGLLRPVWKAPDGKQVETARREKKQTWRRVQDDNDDNEQWVLDGGLHGYTN